MKSRPLLFDPMLPEFLAMLAALSFAGAQITTRRGLVSTTVTAGFLISLVSGWLMLIAMTLSDPPTSIRWNAVVAFGGAGLMTPGLGRLASISAVRRLGASISTSIQGSTYPLLSLAGGALLFGERLSFLGCGGVALIVVGVWRLSLEAEKQVAEALPTTLDRDPPTPKARPNLNRGVALSLAAGLCFAGSDILKKQGLDFVEDPIFGALIGTSAALVAWVVLALSVPKVRQEVKVDPPGGTWFVATGFLSALAILATMKALENGDVSVVSPIIAAQPLFVFLLSGLLLRSLERVTRPIVLAGISTVAGAWLVSIA